MDQHSYPPSHALSGTMAIAFNDKSYPKYSSSSVQDSHLFPFSVSARSLQPVDTVKTTYFDNLKYLIFLMYIMLSRLFYVKEDVPEMRVSGTFLRTA